MLDLSQLQTRVNVPTAADEVRNHYTYLSIIACQLDVQLRQHQTNTYRYTAVLQKFNPPNS